jgi:hypothetical protein
LGGLYSFTYHVKTELTQQQITPVEILTPAEFTKLRAGVRDRPDAPPASKTAENRTAEKRPDKPREERAHEPAKPAPPARKKPAPPARKKAAAAPAQAAPPHKPRSVELPERKPKSSRPRKPAERKPAPAKPREAPPKRASQPDSIASLLNRQEAKRKARRKHRRQAEKSRFDAEKIAALLNRVPDADRQAPARSEPSVPPRAPWRPPGSLDDQANEDHRPSTKLTERLPQGAPAGAAEQMSVNEIDAFRSQISRCWSPPVSGLGEEALIVKLRIELNQDGSLLRPPQVMNRGNSPFFQAAADSAVRAVFECQPYSMPRSKYKQWRDMVLNFDPRQMFGG